MEESYIAKNEKKKKIAVQVLTRRKRPEKYFKFSTGHPKVAEQSINGIKDKSIENTD